MFNCQFNQVRVLDNDSLNRLAPSIFAEIPASNTSEKYFFIPTITVIDQIRQHGLVPVAASQSRSKTDGGQDFVKHMIRFRRVEDMDKQLLNLGDAATELVLVNSHNGTTSFQLNLGLFRQVCANGLIASNDIASETVKHVGYKHHDIIEAQYKVLGNETKLIESVSQFRDVQLNQDEKIAFAESALKLRYDDSDTKPRAEQLIAPRRYGDNASDLWTVFNVVQENMIHGGLRTISRNDRGQVRRNSTRAVNSVNENKRLNQALWTLAESMKQIKAS